jgi:hypothetical protein
MAGEEWSAVVEWRWLREQVNGLHWLERLMTLELPGTRDSIHRGPQD